MEAVTSAVTGDLVSRFISFLMNKYWDHASLDEKMERMLALLQRVRTVVDEADGRYITNSGMLVQLKTLTETMYEGYHVMDAFKYSKIKDSSNKEVSESSSLSYARPSKRNHTTFATTNMISIVRHELQRALENLEISVTNISEFVALLSGCDRVLHRPFDAYIYIDNFMFARHTEKQQVTNILLQDNSIGAPTVLPIIGGYRVGKKTLIAHICDNERVRSSFSSILHLNGDNLSIIDNQQQQINKTLVIVSFYSNVSDSEWSKFYSSLACMGKGSKVVILSRLEIVARFGTVKPIHLSCLSNQEFSYLFKTLAFGSANPQDYPQLLSLAQEFATELEGSLIGAHVVAAVLRKNINQQFWLCILEMFRRIIQRNFSLYGEHLKILFGRNHPVDMSANTVSSASTPLHLVSNVSKSELPKVIFGDLLVDPSLRPKGEFNPVTWESRIPPYTTFVHYVPSCHNENSEASSQGKKRRRTPV